MCCPNGIECCLSAKCKSLCSAANEWANNGQVGLQELPLTEDYLDIILSKRIMDRVDCILPGMPMVHIDLSVLTPRQRQVLIMVLFDPSGEKQTYKSVGKRLDIGSTAVRDHYHCAKSKLRKIYGR